MNVGLLESIEWSYPKDAWGEYASNACPCCLGVGKHEVDCKLKEEIDSERMMRLPFPKDIEEGNELQRKVHLLYLQLELVTCNCKSVFKGTGLGRDHQQECRFMGLCKDIEGKSHEGWVAIA